MKTKIMIFVFVFLPLWMKGGFVLLGDDNRYSYSCKGVRIEVIGPIKTISLAGFAYKIRMTNVSNHSVEIDSSLVASDCIDDSDIMYDKRLLCGIGLTGVLGLGIGLPYIMGNFQARYNMHLLFAMGISAGNLLFSLYFLKEYYNLEKNIFRGTSTILPGQKLEKVFWLRQVSDGIVFNYDAIRVREP